MSSHHRTLGLFLLAAGAAVIALTPASADAQLLKKIKKAAQDAVVDATAGKAAPAGSDAAATQAQANRSETIEITEATIDTFLVAMRPMLAEAERRQAALAAERKLRDYDACIENTAQGVTTAPTAAGMAESEKYMNQLVSVQQAYAAALQAGDEQRAAALEDSVTTLADLQAKAIFPVLKQCGARPRKPVRERAEKAVPTRPAGMTATSFGRLRERIALHLLTDGEQGPTSDAERAALASRKEQLAPLAPLFKNGSLEWGTWHQLRRGWEGNGN